MKISEVVDNSMMDGSMKSTTIMTNTTVAMTESTEALSTQAKTLISSVDISENFFKVIQVQQAQNKQLQDNIQRLRIDAQQKEQTIMNLNQQIEDMTHQITELSNKLAMSKQFIKSVSSKMMEYAVMMQSPWSNMDNHLIFHMSNSQNMLDNNSHVPVPVTTGATVSVEMTSTNAMMSAENENVTKSTSDIQKIDKCLMEYMSVIQKDKEPFHSYVHRKNVALVKFHKNLGELEKSNFREPALFHKDVLDGMLQSDKDKVIKDGNNVTLESSTDAISDFLNSKSYSNIARQEGKNWQVENNNRNSITDYDNSELNFPIPPVGLSEDKLLLYESGKYDDNLSIWSKKGRDKNTWYNIRTSHMTKRYFIYWINIAYKNGWLNNCWCTCCGMKGHNIYTCWICDLSVASKTVKKEISQECKNKKPDVSRIKMVPEERHSQEWKDFAKKYVDCE